MWCLSNSLLRSSRPNASAKLHFKPSNWIDAYSFHLLEEINFASQIFFLHKPALPVNFPKSPHIRRFEITLIVRSHDFANRQRCLGCMIEWNARAMVMHNMSFNSAVKNMASDEAKVSVYCWRCASQKRPCFWWIIRNWNICMLQVRYGNCEVSSQFSVFIYWG